MTVCFPGSTRVGITTKPPGSKLFPVPICEPCALGTVAPTPGSSCFACPTNTYAAGDGIACSACPPLSTAAAGSTAAADCACLPGYEPLPNASAPARFGCSPCAAGSFYDFTASSCAVCPLGSYSSAPASTACSPVPPGYVVASPPASISLCPAGSAPAANGSACAPCPPGSASAGGAVFCAPDPPGLASALSLSGSIRLSLAGGSVAWSAAQYAAFDAALAASLGLPPAAVASANATAAAAAPSHARRALRQAPPPPSPPPLSSPPALPPSSTVPFTVTNKSLATVSSSLAAPGFGASLASALAASPSSAAFPPVSVAALIAVGSPVVAYSAACGAGAFQNTTSGACEACPSGAVASPGSTACNNCPSGAYAASPNASSCSVCPLGSTSPPLSAGVGACMCSVGGKSPTLAATANGSASLACPPAPTASASPAGVSPQALGGIFGGVLGGCAALAACFALALRRHLRHKAARAATWKAFLSEASEVTLGKPLGAGGFGSVFAATWRGTDVAVKVLHDDVVKRSFGFHNRTSPRGGGGGGGPFLPGGAAPPPTWPDRLGVSRAWNSRALSARSRLSSKSVRSEDVNPAFVREVARLCLDGKLQPPSDTSLRAPRRSSWASCATQTVRPRLRPLARARSDAPSSSKKKVLAVYAVVLTPQTMLIMELGTAGSLADVLRRNTLYTLPWLQRVTLGVGIAAGVDFLHSQTPRIYHLDLNSASAKRSGTTCRPLLTSRQTQTSSSTTRSSPRSATLGVRATAPCARVRVLTRTRMQSARTAPRPAA